MIIEFDPAKDVANRAKHGLSLAEATDFEFTSAVIVEDARRDYGEVRLRAFTRDGGGRCLIFTPIGPTSIRAISYRRAHDKELRRYGL
jgi:uncharacterized DUF497 family protein